MTKVVYNTGDYLWYTPIYLVELAREVMGSIDLDPASDEFGNSRIKAKSFYSEQQNGLNLDWSGKVWLNPPYHRNLIKQFVSKMNSEYRKGNTTEAIMLVNNSTETPWFQSASFTATAAVFPLGRIRFERTDGVRNSPLQGQTLFYYGDNMLKFLNVFCEVGFGVVLPQ